MYSQIYHTERLLIRPLTNDDIPVWEKFFHCPECVKYLPAQAEMTTMQRAEFWIDKQLNRYKDNRFGLMALTDQKSGDFIGQCGLLTQELDGEPVLEIGYHLFPQFWKKGFATEAATFFKELAFEHNYAQELVSIIDVGNLNSQRVALRNGMKKTKTTTYWGLDVYLFTIQSKDWKEPE